MLSIVQKYLYYVLALLVPGAIGLLPFMQKHFSTGVICLIYALGIIGIILLSFCWLKLCFAKITKMPIKISQIEPYDIQNLSVVLTYAVPLISLIITNDENLFYIAIIVLVFFIIVTLMNTVLPNPFFLLRYHLYKVTIKDGVSGYLLLSSRKITYVHEITTVYPVFDYFGVDGNDRA